MTYSEVCSILGEPNELSIVAGGSCVWKSYSLLLGASCFFIWNRTRKKSNRVVDKF